MSDTSSTSTSLPVVMNFPAELLRQIFIYCVGIPDISNHLGDDSRALLTTLALVATSWKRVAYELLYGQMALPWRRSKVVLLVRTFEEEFSLMALVKSFESSGFEGRDLKQLVERQHEDELEALEEGLKRLVQAASAGEGDRVSDEVLREAFDGHERKVRELSRDHPDMSWIQGWEQRFEGEDVRLESSRVADDACEFLTSLLPGFHNLRRLSLSTFPSFPNISSTTEILNQLTYLELYDIALPDFHTFVSHTPNLVFLSHVSEIQSSNDEDESNPLPPPTLPLLRRLALPVLSNVYCQTFFNLHSPHLVTLSLTNSVRDLRGIATAETISAPALEYLYLNASLLEMFEELLLPEEVESAVTGCENLRHLSAVNIKLDEILPKIQSTKLEAIDFIYFSPPDDSAPHLLVPKLLSNSIHLTTLRKLRVCFPKCPSKEKAVEMLPGWEAECRERGIEFELDWDKPPARDDRGALDRSLQEWRTGVLANEYKVVSERVKRMLEEWRRESVVFVLKALALSYESKYLDFKVSEQKGAPFLDINPNGRIPALTDNATGFTVWESCAIILYLVDKYDTDHKISAVQGSAEYFKIVQWLFFQASGQGPYYGQAWWFKVAHHEQLPSAITRYENEVLRVLGVIESVLRKQEWLVGGKPSVADFSFVSWHKSLLNADSPILPAGSDVKTQFPAVPAWHMKLLEITFIKDAVEERNLLSAQ